MQHEGVEDPRFAWKRTASKATSVRHLDERLGEMNTSEKIQLAGLVKASAATSSSLRVRSIHLLQPHARRRRSIRSLAFLRVALLPLATHFQPLDLPNDLSVGNRALRRPFSNIVERNPAASA